MRQTSPKKNAAQSQSLPFVGAFFQDNHLEITLLYRGDCRAPGTIFCDGFSARGANLDLALHTYGELNDSAHISTTTELAVAKRFSLSGSLGNQGYVYEINPQKNAVDIVQKFAAQNNDYVNEYVNAEKEMAVPHKIKNTDIKGAWLIEEKTPIDSNWIPVQRKEYIPNPHYVAPFSKTRQVLKITGHGLTVVGVFVDGVNLYLAYQQGLRDGSHESIITETTRVVGGWSGAIVLGTACSQAGSIYGAFLGPIGSLIGGAACGLMGSIAGYYAGGTFSVKLKEFIVEIAQKNGLSQLFAELPKSPLYLVAYPPPSVSLQHINETRSSTMHQSEKTNPNTIKKDNEPTVAERAQEIITEQDASTEKLIDAIAAITTKIEDNTISANNFFNTDGMLGNLKEISSMIGDAAFLANVLNQSELGQKLSLVSGGIDRTILGFEKTKNAVSFFSSAAGALSLISGVTGILGAVGFFSNHSQIKAIEALSGQIQCLGKQIEHLGKQLDCVLKNQMLMADTLIVAYQRIEDIHCRLRSFETATRKNFQFLTSKDLNEAIFKLSKKSAISLSKEKLCDALEVLQLWLRVHLTSEMMNGAVYGGISPAESIQILASLDISLSADMVGFILKQLQYKGILIPDEYFKLPPMELYLRIFNLFCKGMEKIKPDSDDGCESIATEVQASCALFSKLLKFLKQNEIQEKLQLLYLNAFVEVKKILVEKPLIILKRDKSHLYERLNGMDKIQKERLLDALNRMEETRLLMCVLSQWTYHSRFFVSQLPTKNDILNMKIFDVNRFSGADYFIRSCDDKGNLKISFLLKYDECTFWSNATVFLYHQLNTPIEFDFDMLIKHRQYEAVIVKLAAAGVHFRMFSSNITHEMRALMRSVNDEHSEHFSANGIFNATHFMTIFSLFLAKYSELQYAYRYYTAYINNTDRLATAYVDPTILLWLVAILGRYDVFQSLVLPPQFNFAAPLGTKNIGRCKLSINPKVPPVSIANGKVYFREVPRTFWLDPSDNDNSLYADNLVPYHATANGNFTFFKQYTPPTTPLMLATKLNHADVVEGLLGEQQRGKDIGLRNRDIYGRSSAKIAFDYGHYQLAESLDQASQILSSTERETIQCALKIPVENPIIDAVELGMVQAEQLKDSYRLGI